MVQKNQGTLQKITKTLRPDREPTDTKRQTLRSEIDNT